MSNIGVKITERLIAGLRKFQPLVTATKAKDANEASTVMLVIDMLSEMFGYDKYSEISSEYAVKNTFCDLAILIDSQVQILIEVKAIGLDLKPAHIKQAVDYAANKGVEWVMLTNGTTWKFFKVLFEKPIRQELVAEFSFPDLSYKNAGHMDLLFLACKEGIKKSALDSMYSKHQATNKFFIAGVITSPDGLSFIRRSIRSLYPDTKIECDEILSTLEKDVLKRELVDGDEYLEAKKKIAKLDRRAEKLKARVPNGVASVSSSEPV